MQDRCAQCLSEIPEELSHETPRGELLCGPCYFALWGPRGERVASAASDRLRPTPTRPKRRRLKWMVPGPSGELDPEEQVRRVRRRRQSR